MNKSTTINISEYQKWDNIIKCFTNYDIYYSPDYVKAFQLHGDGMPLLFYYDDKVTRAINVIMKRDIAKDAKFSGNLPLDTYFDVITPYGYGGFLIEGKKDEIAIKNIFEKYNEFCINNNIISEFVRFHPFLKNNIGLEKEYNIINLGKTVSIELKSSKYIWDNLNSKNRNVIRKAKKYGVEIYWGRNKELLDIFIDMYNVTMDNDDAKDYYYFKEKFYNSILFDLKYNSLMFYAVYDGKIIAISIILFLNNIMHYHLSASVREYLTYAPTNLLLYEAACWGFNNGYDIFHLGGGLGSKEDSLYKFKKSFNKNNHNDYYIGKKVFDEKKYDELVEIRSGENNFDKDSNFFPIYRA